MAEIFFKMNLDFWGSRFVVGTFNVIADALKLALKDNIINEKDFFLTDKELIEKLRSSNNKTIIEKLELVKNPERFVIGTPNDYDIFGSTKMRFIDPKFLNRWKNL